MEPISLVLDSFIQLAERIISLEKTKREDKQQVFKEIIEPLFIQLQPVAENYITIFRKARKRVVDNPYGNLGTAIKEIRELRETMDLARATIRTMAWQISDMYEDEKITGFSNSISRFFYASIYPIGGEMLPTQSEELVEMLERGIDFGEDKATLVEYIDNALRGLERSWAKIGRSYAAVKIHCLSAPRLIKKTK